MKNRAALKLPDQLLVRYYRQGQIDHIKKVDLDQKTRAVMVTLTSGAVESWKYLIDLGWIPDAA